MLLSLFSGVSSHLVKIEYFAKIEQYKKSVIAILYF
jgi:hypothetical protein